MNLQFDYSLAVALAANGEEIEQEIEPLYTRLKRMEGEGLANAGLFSGWRIARTGCGHPVVTGPNKKGLSFR